MSRMRTIFTLCAILALLLTTSVSAIASGGAVSGTGTVNAIMAAENKINITHGPIPTLGWSGMTMDFRLADAVTLEGIEVGSKVTFRLRKAADGMYEIESLSLSKD